MSNDELVALILEYPFEVALALLKCCDDAEADRDGIIRYIKEELHRK
jgi:hypothetical protein